MKILLTSDMYTTQINGVSASIITLKNELIKKGHDVRVLSLSSNKKSCIDNNDYLFGSYSVPFYPGVRQTRKYKDPMIKDIVSWNPDIIHIQTEFSTCKIGKKIAKLCNCPYVTTCHTFWEEYSGYIGLGKNLGRFVAKKIVRKFNKGSKAIIIPTEKMRSVLDRYSIKGNILSIPSGIDLDRFSKKFTDTEKNKLKQELNIPKDAKILVSVGRVAKEKNIDELLDYMPSLIEKENNIFFVIGGGGPYQKKLEEKVKKLNLGSYVRFTGMIQPKNTYKYFKLGDIFVCASQTETQGITYIEALASGTPLVCRYDKCLDGVVQNGTNGFMYNTKEEYINYISEIFNNKSLYEKFKKNTVSSSQKFSKENFGDSIEKLYISVINDYKKGSVESES